MNRVTLTPVQVSHSRCQLVTQAVSDVRYSPVMFIMSVSNLPMSVPTLTSTFGLFNFYHKVPILYNSLGLDCYQTTNLVGGPYINPDTVKHHRDHVRPLTTHGLTAVRSFPCPAPSIAIDFYAPFPPSHLGGSQVSEQARIFRLCTYHPGEWQIFEQQLVLVISRRSHPWIVCGQGRMDKEAGRMEGG